MNFEKINTWTAIVTPLNEDLTVDFDSYQSLLKEQNEAGNGVLVLGSTGEALNLSLVDKKKIIDYSISQNLDVPLMVGVGGHDFQSTKSWVNFLNTKELSSYLMVTPIYSKPSDEGQFIWFKELMDLSKRPVVLYNVPGRSGTLLSFEAVKRLKDHKNYFGIKEASGDVNIFKKYLEASGGKKVFCGDDGLMYEFAAAGSCGLISVAANTWPKATNRYVKACLTNELSKEERELWSNAASELFCTSNPVPAKALLQIEGRIKSGAMMPPLSDKDLPTINKLRKYSEQITNWFQK